MDQQTYDVRKQGTEEGIQLLRNPKNVFYVLMSL